MANQGLILCIIRNELVYNSKMDIDRKLVKYKDITYVTDVLT